MKRLLFIVVLLSLLITTSIQSKVYFEIPRAEWIDYQRVEIVYIPEDGTIVMVCFNVMPEGLTNEYQLGCTFPNDVSEQRFIVGEPPADYIFSPRPNDKYRVIQYKNTGMPVITGLWFGISNERPPKPNFLASLPVVIR